MIDNLRRTLSRAVDPGHARRRLDRARRIGRRCGPAFVLATTMIPALLPVVTGLLPQRQGISKRSHLAGRGRATSVWP